MGGRVSGGTGPLARIAALYDRHAAALYRHALMILADRELAADVVQQVFVRLLTGTGRMNDAPGYLHTAVRNECYSHLRRRRREPVNRVEHPMLQAVPGLRDCPDERLALESAMRTLSPDQRETVHLKVFEGRTFQEIAAITGDSINTVASRYRYALTKLRTVLSTGG